MSYLECERYYNTLSTYDLENEVSYLTNKSIKLRTLIVKANLCPESGILINTLENNYRANELDLMAAQNCLISRMGSKITLCSEAFSQGMPEKQFFDCEQETILVPSSR